MDTSRSKLKQSWLDSDEGRISTLVQKGLLSAQHGARLLIEIQAAKLKAQSQKSK